MIFSTKNKYIYIRVPKTASTTISSRLLEIDPSALRNAVELPDGRQKYVDTHITARQLKGLLGEAFREYRVVAFVRDPVSLIASKYYFYRQVRDRVAGKAGRARVAIWLKVLSANILPLPLWAMLYPYKKSSHFILDHDGEILATDIGSFEELTEDFARIFSDIGLPKNELVLDSKKNTTVYGGHAPKGGRVLSVISQLRFRKDYKIISHLQNKSEDSPK